MIPKRHLCASTACAMLGVMGLTACDRNAGGMTPNTVDMSRADMSVPEDMTSVVMIPTGPMAGRTAMRLLTRYEYDNTVSDLLGVTSTEALLFPPENSADGFENNAWVHKVNPVTLRYYMEASERLAKTSYATPPSELAACAGSSPDATACKQGFSVFLARAFRRPVSDDEIAIIHGLYDKFLAEENAEQAYSVSLQGVLQAPQFLYRVELYEPSTELVDPLDGEMTSEEFERVGPYEMASRLSYFFWSTMPDATLIELAERGDLNTPDVLKAQVARLLADARSRRMVHQFHRQWLGLDKLENLSKDRAIYPQWDNDLRHDLRASLDAFVEHAYWEEGSFSALMRSNAVFMTPAMATLYEGGVEPAHSGGFWKAEMPATQRRGLLTQPGLLAMLSYANQGSPIARAVFVREKLFCQHLPPPPSDEDITPPDPDPTATTREIFAVHTKEEKCAGCHTLIDPLGFGMEDYDGLGRFRTMENGKAIDSSGELVGSPDERVNKRFKGGVALAELIADSDVIASCLAEHWFTFAMGRHSDASDEASFEHIESRFAQSGRRFSVLFESIVLSDSFRFRKKRDIADKEAMP